MKYNASLAWAMPVDPVVLGPQIEAYVETKGKMPAFQRCVEHAPFGTSLGQVPAEVIEIIGGHVRHLTFLVHQERWKSEIECWHGTCCPSKHIDHNEYLRLKHDYMKGFETFGPRLIGGVEEYGHYRSQEFDATQFEKHLKRRGVGDYGHRMQTERFEAKIDHRNNQFNSARKIFFEDFGLDIYFAPYKDLPSWAIDISQSHSEIYENNLLAYLSLPLGMMRIFPTANTATFHSLMVVHSPSIYDLTEKQISAFKRVKNILALVPLTDSVRLKYDESIENSRRPTKRDIKQGLRNSFHEKKVDIKAIQWPQFMALAYGDHWRAKRSKT